MSRAAYTSTLAQTLAEDLLDRFTRYVRIDTQSAEGTTATPSTPGQLELASLLERELRELGLEDVRADEQGYVMATLPAAGGARGAPAVALLAHLDTSPDAPGAGVEPLVHRGYDGGTIRLPRGETVLDPERMPELRARAGHDIITSSGDTLLGADDKAGVAEVMAAVRHLVHHPELPRTTLRVCFTPDEEIGGVGARKLDLEALDARCAYTVDGSEVGELQDESFSAREATVLIEGVDVHPGQAYGKLVNAARLAGRILAELPADRLTPETTQGREGFIHVRRIDGDAHRVTLTAILRDFDDATLEEHERLLRETAERVVSQEPRARLHFSSQEQYRNMRHFLAGDPEVVARAERAMLKEGVKPTRTAIRGGTDGSVLSERGLPTPNVFTGGHEYHSVREWASLQDMATATAVLVRLAGEWATVGDAV